ncbi:MAG TPA: hypothetical protein QF353_05085 [Gammaproteobacteria bacterium]|nr:hypothetical protein [Gammaproteobacteria bacterium]
MLVATIHSKNELYDQNIWNKADLLELRLDRLNMSTHDLKLWRKSHDKPILLTDPTSSKEDLIPWLELKPEWIDIPFHWGDDAVIHGSQYAKIVRSLHLESHDYSQLTPQQIFHEKASHVKYVFPEGTALDGLKALALQQQFSKSNITLFCQGNLAQGSRFLAPHWGGWEYTYVHHPLAKGQRSLEEAYPQRNSLYRYAIVGHSIDHSLSPAFHNQLFQEQQHPGTYIKLDIAPHEFEEAMTLIQQLKFHGLSITSPYKFNITSHLHQANQDSVNTVVLKKDNYVGYNTDGIGCMNILKSQPIKCLGIVGLGGTGIAIAKAAKQHQLKTILCNRSNDTTQDIASHLNNPWVKWENIDQLMACDMILVCLPRQVTVPKIIHNHPNFHTVNYQTNDSVDCFGKKLFYSQARLQNQLWVNHRQQTLN